MVFLTEPNSYAALFISCCVCSWFLTEPNCYASLFISSSFCSWFVTEPTRMLLCLSLVVFVHGFSQNQLLCFFVYLLFFLFIVPHRTNSYAYLFISCCFCSWFLTEPTPMLLFFISCCVCSWFLTEPNSYAYLFISYCFCSWFVTEPTAMLLCLSLVVFVHGFSQNQPVCFFVYLLLFLFMVSHRTNSYASLFISCSSCSWFLTSWH
jgi:hypothetical protein